MLYICSTHLLRECEHVNLQLELTMDKFVEDREYLLMQIVLRYFNILATEKKSYLQQLTREMESLGTKRQHICIDNDFQVIFFFVVGYVIWIDSKY